MKRLLLACCVLFGCAAADKALVYTENGLRAGEQSWDGHYRSEATRCEKLHEPETPDMETCFGDTYDADAKVETAIKSAVALLRAYWTARAAGQSPDWGAVAQQVKAILDDLPPEAVAYFAKVSGL
jgi:hypothetical protein